MTAIETTEAEITEPKEEVHYLNVTKGFMSWAGTLDHKRIGLMYLAGVSLAFLVGGLIALTLRMHLWEPDGDYVNTGNSFTRGSAISGTTMDPLYQSERWDGSSSPAMTYALPVSDGTYEVILHFAEIYSGAAAVGGRVFSVFAEGESILQNYDIFAEVRFLAAVEQAFTINVTDGLLEIEFVHGAANNPKISAIEVLSLGP